MRFDAAQRRQPIRGEPNARLADRIVILPSNEPGSRTRAMFGCDGSQPYRPLGLRIGQAREEFIHFHEQPDQQLAIGRCAQARGIGSARLFGARAMTTCRLLGLSGADNSRPAAEGDGAATSGWTNGRTLPRDLCLQLTPRLRADESRIVDVCDETPRPPTMVAAVSGAAAIPEPVRARRVSEPGWGCSAVKLRRVDSLSQLTSLVDMAARRRGGDGESA